MTVVDGSVTGAAPLIRFMLRRDRVRIVVWVASIGALVVTTAASVKGLYPTAASLQQAARASEGNTAAIIFNGPAQGLDTVGGQIAFQTGTIGLIVVGLMSVFMLGRLTRGEEEAGRAELLRSLPIGAHSLSAAALTVVGVMNLVTGALATVSLAAYGLPRAGSVNFGLSLATFGALMMAITFVAAQVTENTRVVSGIGGLVLGAAFVLRAIGDIGNGAVSWLSPIGWAQKTRPFAGDRWWPYLVIVGAATMLGGTAMRLSRRRDLGAGLVPPRPGPARATPRLGTPSGLAMRLQRGSLIGWGIGLALLAAAYGSVADSINDFVQDNQALADFVAAQGRGTFVEQYVAMTMRILAIAAAGFAIQSALRIRSEETSTHAEMVLATGVSRARLAASHLTVAFAGTSALSLLMGVTFGVTDALVSGDPAAIGTAITAALGFIPALWVLIGAAAALTGLVPRASGTAWGLLAICFVIGMFGQLLELPGWVLDLSPFQHVPPYPAGDVEVLPLVLLTLLAIGLTEIGVAGFRRRDIA